MNEWLSYTFMRRGLLASVLVGTACGLIGPYVVLRRISFIGHALTHSALPGLVAAHVHGVPPFLGAFAANVLTALGISRLSTPDRSREDAVVAILSNGMFALGLVWMARLHSFRDLSHMLFGNILGVSVVDLWVMAAVVLLVGGALLLFHKEWELLTYDPDQAELIGLPVERMRLFLLLLLVLVVVAGIQAVGTVLTGALLIAPAWSALLLCRRLDRVLMVSCGLGSLSGVLGLAVSSRWSIPSGAAIVLSATAMFAAAWGIRFFNLAHRPKRGERR